MEEIEKCQGCGGMLMPTQHNIESHLGCLIKIYFNQAKSLREGNYKDVIQEIMPPEVFLEHDSYEISTSITAYVLRLVWRKQFYSWALPPTIEQIHLIRDIIGKRTIIEIGLTSVAGSGLWAALLRNTGCDIIATDSKAEPTTEYINVEAISCNDAIAKYGSIGTCLFVS